MKDSFSLKQEKRHIGPDKNETKEMLSVVKYSTIESFIDDVIPTQIRNSEEKLQKQLSILGGGLPEHEALEELKQIASKNVKTHDYIGKGYHPTVVPSVILRNILENPAWYTSYTPYQAEISQGRMESLFNFQTLIVELTGMSLSNASLLDEATSAAEALFLAHNIHNKKRPKFFLEENTFDFIKSLIYTKAKYLDITVVEGSVSDLKKQDLTQFSGVLVQNPNSNGNYVDYTEINKQLKQNNVVSTVACDIASLLIFKSPAEMGFDIAVGSAQRFGVPMMNGGPHAGFFAVREEYKRKIPGRVIGQSKDSHGNPAFRLSMQTREQHIRREKATSNICTAQALLANTSTFYAIFHGKKGLIRTSERISVYANILADQLKQLGYNISNKKDESDIIFDTIQIKFSSENEAEKLRAFLETKAINVWLNGNKVSVSMNEAVNVKSFKELLLAFASFLNKSTTFCFEKITNHYKLIDILESDDNDKLKQNHFVPATARRSNNFLSQPIFNTLSSETEIMRYMMHLQKKDISLTESMISLGSCTMKMNAATEMIPVTWPELAEKHPFAPKHQLKGYNEMIDELSSLLCTITQFDCASLQPNSGANGEFAGLLAIRRYHDSRGDTHRNVCLIPQSAHGTNPASASVLGMTVVVVSCDDKGNISVEDLRQKAEKHKDKLAALMITYPSTHGVFEVEVKEITQIVHDFGGLVYMDGANMNAQCLLTSPEIIGGDVCHLNLHKTFCIPHGGGGPGVGPILARKFLEPFLPGHFELGHGVQSFATTSAPFGSAGILPIPYLYIKMMGCNLIKSTQMAILGANYLMERLGEHYKILYKGINGKCAHEVILDFRTIKKETGISEEDVAKRLMDYGFHAPTMSFPVPGTMMIEPTESEDK